MTGFIVSFSHRCLTYRTSVCIATIQLRKHNFYFTPEEAANSKGQVPLTEFSTNLACQDLHRMKWFRLSSFQSRHVYLTKRNILICIAVERLWKELKIKVLFLVINIPYKFFLLEISQPKVLEMVTIIYFTKHISNFSETLLVYTFMKFTSFKKQTLL